MKKLLVIFLILNLYSFSVNASEIIQTPEAEIENTIDWDNMVDYINSKITLFYIQEQIKKDNVLSKVELENFKTFESELDQSNLKNVISFNRLKELLSTNYDLTFKKLNVPINNLKNREYSDFDSLFNDVSNILIERSSAVQQSDHFHELKDSINTYIFDQQTKEKNLASISTEEKGNPDIDRNSYISYSTLLVLAVLFFFSTLVFIIGWLHVRSENKSKKLKIKSLESALETKERELTQLKTIKTTLESTSRDRFKPVKSEDIRAGNDQNNLKKQNDNIIEEKKSPEIVLPVQAKEPENKIEQLYAGKPTENRTLKDITPQSDPQQTIFKLNILPDNNELAEFEVFHVSDFMTRSITNAPDDYLYRVCNHENTNQEFRKEILTVKKGTANLIDGEWIVKEENKATIKFQ